MLQELLTKAPILAIFDAGKKIKGSTDASKGALGAVLFQMHGQDWRPEAYASRVLTDNEGRYSQIEKEALGIVYGCERFHDFIDGRHISAETDHSPLISIDKKCIGATAVATPLFEVNAIRLTARVPARKSAGSC